MTDQNDAKTNQTTSETIEDKVRSLLENEIRPVIQRDGGDIVYMGMDGNTVKVQLQGACVGCPHSAQTLYMGVERYLKQMIPEVEGIISV